MAKQVVVDSHVHILPDRVRAQVEDVRRVDAWFGACHVGKHRRVAGVDELIIAMDAAEIDYAVCSSWPFTDPALCSEANDYIAQCVRLHPNRLTGLAVVQPRDPGAVKEIQRCFQIGLPGIGELNADAQGWTVDDASALDPIMALLNSAHHPLLLHCSEPIGHDYPGKGTMTPDRIVHLAERYPENAIICGHLGGGLPLYAHMPEISESCRNLWFDTAAAPFLYRDTIYDSLASAVPASQLLFGSDFPLLTRERYVSGIGKLAAEDQAAVWGGNAAALFHLGA